MLFTEINVPALISQRIFGLQRLVLAHNLKTEWHQHPCLQLSVSLHDSPLGLDIGAGQQNTYGFLVSSNLRHKVHAEGQCFISLFIDPADPGYTLLSHRLPQAGVLYIDKETAHNLAAVLLANMEQDLPPELSLVSTYLGGERHCSCLQDKRIVKAASLVAALESRRVSSREISSQIYLSESRFLHLFRAKIGVNFRRYLLWQRLQGAISAMTSQTSLTSLARDNGFADSAHFSRTCMMAYGLRPSDLKQATTKSQLSGFYPWQGCHHCLESSTNTVRLSANLNAGGESNTALARGNRSHPDRPGSPWHWS